MIKFFGPERYKCKENNTQVEIHKNPFVVGRGSTADLVLASLQVSRAHCRFSQSDGRKNWLLECLSNNGLRVDGHRLEPGEIKVLPSESLITLTDDVHILFSAHTEDLHSRSIEIVDVPKLNTHTSDKQDLKPGLDSYADRLSKAFADLARERSSAAEERNNLQMRLSEEERKVCDAKLRIETLDRKLKKLLALQAKELSKVSEASVKEAKAAEAQDLERRLSEAERKALDAEQRSEKLDQEIKSMLALHAEELSKAQAQVAEATVKQAKAAEEEQDLNKRLSEGKKGALDAEQRFENLDRELKTALALHSGELSKSRAEIVEATVKQALAEKEVLNLQKRLSKEESKVLDAEQRNKHLEVEILEAHSKLLKNTATTDELAEKLAESKRVQTRIVNEFDEARQKNNCLQLELTALQTVADIKEANTERLKTELEAALQDAAKYKASLSAREEENRNMGLEMISVQAVSSNLSDEVAKYKRYWEDSEVKSFAESQEKAKLTKELAALKEATTKVPEVTDKQLNDIKEAARMDQVREFEEFVETDLQCAICFELVIAATALNCGHTFCSKCVRDWQARSPNCPTCRVQITTMQRCKMLDSFIARAAGKLSEDFRARRREATGGRGTDSQGQPQRKKTKKAPAARGRRINFDQLPGPEPVPEALFFVDLT